MKTKWFGDNRDLVKWAALLHIARQQQISVVVQICFLNPHKFPPITVNGKSVPVPNEVIKHFRSLHSVQRLSNEIAIKVFDLPFKHRRAYLKAALEFVGQSSGQRRVVLLDPDTGLAPRKPDLTHVTDAEVREIWTALAPGDAIILYQHQTNKNGQPWVEPKRKQFATAIGLRSSRVHIVRGRRIASDVVFYYANKV